MLLNVMSVMVQDLYIMIIMVLQYRYNIEEII